ncbi:MAG: class I SAM-dependent methyltransferase [candidate division Zixibacteria bacterium]|nr:class I SAM-dependent methyltransferase [candidate division Zixibacteria bacterium]
MAKVNPFEKHTSDYENWFEKNHFAYTSELNAIKEQLPKNGDGLEIGVGSARFAAPLGIEFGIEPSSRMRKIAKQRGIEVIGGIAENLPFANAQFDYILMVTTICFLDDIGKAFREAHRVLKKSGYFIVGFVDKSSTLGKLYEKNKNENKFYKVATFYSADEVISHMKQAGFGEFNFVQTIFHTLNEITEVEPVKNGLGQGSFIVISAKK